MKASAATAARAETLRRELAEHSHRYHVLDEERNALGRQRIAHLRDELRAWDRKQERNQIKPGR